eukprot:4484932-Heterocapsa_arctica.AAC.1
MRLLHRRRRKRRGGCSNQGGRRPQVAARTARKSKAGQARETGRSQAHIHMAQNHQGSSAAGADGYPPLPRS